MPPKKEEILRYNVGPGQEYPTLSKALSAIDANESNAFHIINVAAGSYHENVVIKKPLEIIGERSLKRSAPSKLTNVFSGSRGVQLAMSSSKRPRSMF